MFAVIKTGGKQYKVAGGTVLKVEKLEGEVGQSVTLDNVLMVGSADSNTIGAAGKAQVVAEILEQAKGEKVIVFKKKRRHNYRRKLGHRQLFTKIRIASISLDGKEVAKADAAAKKPAAKKAEAAADAKPAKKPAAKKASSTAKKPAAKKAAKAKEE